MMTNLWDYLTNVAKSMPVGAEGLAKLATEPARFTANGVQSVYDSFKRGMQPAALGEDPYLKQQRDISDAFNVAGAAMVGGMPGVPKGNSPSTLGMAFRSPKDVVYTPKGEFNPVSSTLKEDFGDNYDLYNLISRYHNKDWGTVNDSVIQHIDKGHRVPDIPGLDARELNSDLEMFQGLGGRLPKVLAEMVQNTSLPLQATTDLGRAVEIARDRRALFQNTGISNQDHVFSSRGMPQKTKDYALNTDGVNMFSKPEISSLATTQLPYKIDGNLNRMSLADMLMQATKHEEAALAKVPIEKLHEFDDGHYWTQLKTQAQREAESAAMGNSTKLSMHDGKDLYSLRDKNGKSILTASRQPGEPTLSELKSRFNHENHLSNDNKYIHDRPYNADLQQSVKNAYYMHSSKLKELLGLELSFDEKGAIYNKPYVRRGYNPK